MKTKILTLFTLPRILALLGLALLVIMSTVRPLEAQQVTIGYSSDQSLERGMIVRLKENDPAKVEALKAEDERHIHGVVVAPNDSPITLSSDDQKIFAATSGRYELLVSTQNGAVHIGDYITISSTDGIGMRADASKEFIVGRALEAFDGSSATAGDSQVNGKTIQYGRVLADITVSANPLYRSPVSSVPNFLQRTVEAVSGKPVSSARVYLTLFIAAATMIVAGTVLYSGVRSSITAIGRNPLSKSAAGKSMLQVGFIGLIIFASGLFAVYLLLKL